MFSPRTYRLSFSLLLLCLVIPQVALAQNSGARKAPASRGDAARTRGARSGQQRREAVAALLEAAQAARTFDDLFYSAKIQTLAASALWPHDEQSARAIYARAWAAATDSDRAELEHETETRARYAGAAQLFTNSREFVLTSVARSDPGLAGAFIQEMDKSISEAYAAHRDPDAPADGQKSEPPYEEMSVASWQRLNLAESLLRGGDAKRAAEIVEPVVGEGVNWRLIKFLLELWRRSPAKADDLYLQLLARTKADAAADANDVLLLSTSVVSPNLIIQVDDDGSIEFSGVRLAGDFEPPAEMGIQPRVRAAFYDAAATILLRQPAPVGGGKEALAKASKLYVATGRLLPFFEREAPQRAPELHARLAALASEIEDARRDALASQMRREDVRSKNPTDPLSSYVDMAANITDAARRDEVLISLVQDAARRKMWDRAERAAAAVSDADTRRKARAYIALHKILNISEAYVDGDEDDFERAAQFVRRVEVVQPLVRAYGLAQVAALAARGKKSARASEIFDEALASAEQTPHGSMNRVAAFAALTALAVRAADAARAWESLASLARAADAVPDYMGDETGFDLLSLERQNSADEEGWTALEAIMPRHPLSDVFAAAVRLDFTRALFEARSLKGDVPRALATVAVAHAALERPAPARKTKARR